jgi:DeoR family transcriptional regulator, L-fucose operon activator
MLADQRQREILDRLHDAGGVRVADLARALEVTEETVRRDLRRLGQTGKLVRTHGGAVPVEDRSRNLPFDVRQTAHLAEKQAIARHALRYVRENDVLGLDASSTACEVARALPDMPLTVVTNSLPATAVLCGRANVRVVSTGGMLDVPSRSWTGSLAEHALDRINITKLFLSAKGVDLARGLSEVDDHQARVKRRLMDMAETIYLLVDHSKFGVKSVVFLAELTEVDVVVTDGGADAGTLGVLAQAGVMVEVAEK